MNEKSLRWGCRRGLRELDTLLLRYLDERYGEADEGEKKAFEALLEWPDDQLWEGIILRLPTEKQVPPLLLIALRQDHAFKPTEMYPSSPSKG
ncbi:MAG: succinate dehydrogenase assembly factor 2 [Methylococcus sp.]